MSREEHTNSATQSVAFTKHIFELHKSTTTVWTQLVRNLHKNSSIEEVRLLQRTVQNTNVQGCLKQMQAVLVILNPNVHATASAQHTEPVRVRGGKTWYFSNVRKIGYRLCGTSTWKLQFKTIGVAKHWRHVVLSRHDVSCTSCTAFMWPTEFTAPFGLWLHLYKLLVHPHCPSRSIASLCHFLVYTVFPTDILVCISFLF